MIENAANILNTIAWDQNDVTGNPNLFADNDIKKVFTNFEIPLRNAGFSGDEDDLIEQWHDLIEYTVKYLKPETTDYHNCWLQYEQILRTAITDCMSSFYSACIECSC